MAKKKDIFGDDILDDGDKRNDLNFFSDLGSSMSPISVGDRIRGEVLSIGKEETYVGNRGPIDLVVSNRELLNEQGQVKVQVGDMLEVLVTQVREDFIRAKPADSRGSTDAIDNLEDAHDMELPIEGRVLESVKGGFRVQIQNYRAFCPLSQMDLVPIKNPQDYVNKKFEFLITQLDERHTNIVLSRRRLLDLVRADREGELLAKIKEGDLIEGRVTRIENFGAFVEVVPLVEGLTHVSELSWARVKHPAEILEVGAPVKVKVLKIGEVDGRLQISLSLKQGGGELDPWLQFVEKNPVGTRVEGQIERKESFGLFVKLATGVTGLLHQSKWRDALEGKAIEAKKWGDSLGVEIDRIDLSSHQIGLRLPGEGEDQSWREHVSAGHPQGMGTLAALFEKAKRK